jgi:hypothetical protein
MSISPIKLKKPLTPGEVFNSLPLVATAKAA